MKFGKILVAVVAVMSIISSSAKAGLFNFDYSDGGTTSGFGQFITNDGPTPYAVSDVTGFATYEGTLDTITGISSYAGADNLLNFPANPAFVSFAGISFSTSSS